MTKRAKPYSIRMIIALGVGAAVCFSLLSFWFMVVQAKRAGHRIVGDVVAVEGQSITIANVRGQATTFIVQEDARLFGIDELSDLVLGQRLMIRGRPNEDAAFVVEGLRVLVD